MFKNMTFISEMNSLIKLYISIDLISIYEVPKFKAKPRRKTSVIGPSPMTSLKPSKLPDIQSEGTSSADMENAAYVHLSSAVRRTGLCFYGL